MSQQLVTLSGINKKSENDNESESGYKPPTYKVIPTLPPIKLLKREPFCDICNALYFKVKASHVCIQCQKLFCNGCNGKHNKDQLFVKHVTFSLEGSDGVTLHCVAHPQENVQLYCETCSKAICVVCALSVHDDHHKLGFKEHIANQKQTILALLQESQDIQQDGFQLKQQIEQEIDTNEAAFQQTSNEITTYYNMLQATLAKKHDMIQKELTDLYSEKQEDLVNAMQELHDKMFNLVDHTSMAKQLAENDIKIIKLNQHFINSFQEALKIDENLSEQVGYPNTLRFLPSYDINVGMLVDTEQSDTVQDEEEEDDDDDDEEENKHQNKLQLNLDSRTSSSLGFHEDIYSTSNPNSEFTSPREGQMLQIQHTTSKTNKTFSETLGSSLTTLPDDLIEHSKKQIYSRTPVHQNVGHVRLHLHLDPTIQHTPQLLFTIDYKDITNSDDLGGQDKFEAVPIGITFKNEHKIIVTQWGIPPRTKHDIIPTYYPAKHGMVMYSLCYGEPSVEQCFDDCSPWAVVMHEGLYYVTDNRCTTRTVQMYTDDGTLHSTWPSHRLTHPRGLAIVKDKILVTDISNRQLRVFKEAETNNPDIILKLGQPGRYKSLLNLNSSFSQDEEDEERLFESPQFVCSNSLGWMIVSDMGKNCVKIFDSEGDHLHDITSTGKDEHLKMPMGVASDMNNNIYVADYGNNRVLKFNLIGEFISTVLSGSKEYVYKPRGIAFYNSMLAVSCHDENGYPVVRIYEMVEQLQKPSLFRCPCDWLRLCTQDEVTKL